MDNLLKNGATQTLNELSQIFSRVKEFNVFASNDVKVTDIELTNDVFTLKITKDKLVINAKVTL